MQELAEAQRRTEERWEALVVRVGQLVDAQQHTGWVVQGLLVDVGHLKGSDLERRYREPAAAHFARILRRIHALSSEEVAALLDEVEEHEPLDERDRTALLETDVVVRGPRHGDAAETYLVVEVSSGIGLYDVERACERARVLSRLTGKPAIGVVAGESITREAEDAARRL